MQLIVGLCLQVIRRRPYFPAKACVNRIQIATTLNLPQQRSTSTIIGIFTTIFILQKTAICIRKLRRLHPTP